MPTDHQPARARKHGNMSRGGGQGQRRPNPPVSGKRSSYPWINAQIIAASETGVLQHLLATVATYLPQMNLVNLSTAIHRLAKLTANNVRAQAELQQHPSMAELLQAITTAFSRFDAEEVQPQSLSNIAWSLAAMCLLDRHLIQVVAQLAVTNIARFKPFELSTMLWALAKLGGKSWSAKPVFHAAAAHIMKQVQHFGFRCLATTAWAFATAKQRHARLFRSIASQMIPIVHVANCQEMANTAWAFGTADFHDDQLFTELAEKALLMLDEFKPQELSNMLWGFASNSFFHEAFYASASVIAQHMDLQAQHLANILWAFARVRSKHPVSQATALALLPHCTKQLETFKPQEVSSTALAVAKCFGHDSDHVEQRATKVGMHGSVFPSTVPPAVHAFFDTATPWALARLNEFSAQSLANTVSAYNMTQVSGATCLFAAVRQEVMQRYTSLEPTALLHLLKSFVAVPQDVAGNVVHALAIGVAHHIDELRPLELQMLSRICVEALDLHRSHDLTTDELRSYCMTLGGCAGTDAVVSSMPIPPPLALPTVSPDGERAAGCMRDIPVFREPLQPVQDKAAVEGPFPDMLFDQSPIPPLPLGAMVDVPPVPTMDAHVLGSPTLQLAPTQPGCVSSCSAGPTEHSNLAGGAVVAQSRRATVLSTTQTTSRQRKLKNAPVPHAGTMLAQPAREKRQYLACGAPRGAPVLTSWQPEELLEPQAVYPPCLGSAHMHRQSPATVEPSLPCGAVEVGSYESGCYGGDGYHRFEPCGFEPATTFVDPLSATAMALPEHTAVAVPLHTAFAPVCAQTVPLGQAVMASHAMAGQRMSRGQGSLSAQKLAPVCELGTNETLLPQQFQGEKAAASSSNCPLFPGDASVQSGGPWWPPEALSGSSPRQRQFLATSSHPADIWRYSVKNSFLHVELSDRSDDDCDDANTDGGSSQRSSSVPSRFDHEEIWEDWHRRNFSAGSQDLGSGSPNFQPYGLKGGMGHEQQEVSVTGAGRSMPSVDPRQLGMLFHV